MEALRAALAEAEQHDQYAAVWLAAECARGLPETTTDTWGDLLEKYAVLARALGYVPLLARLGWSDTPPDAGVPDAATLVPRRRRTDPRTPVIS
jgi:hypothetical protein